MLNVNYIDVTVWYLKVGLYQVSKWLLIRVGLKGTCWFIWLEMRWDLNSEFSIFLGERASYGVARNSHISWKHMTWSIAMQHLSLYDLLLSCLWMRSIISPSLLLISAFSDPNIQTKICLMDNPFQRDVFLHPWIN